MYIKILGDNSQPHMITLLTKCTGPIVKVLTPDIDFGRVEVLRPYTQTVKIHN